MTAEEAFSSLFCNISSLHLSNHQFLTTSFAFPLPSFSFLRKKPKKPKNSPLWYNLETPSAWQGLWQPSKPLFTLNHFLKGYSGGDYARSIPVLRCRIPRIYLSDIFWIHPFWSVQLALFQQQGGCVVERDSSLSVRIIIKVTTLS